VTDDIDWSLTTFEGLRMRQHQEFRALPLREKIECIEEMDRLAEYFAAKRAERLDSDPARSRPGSGGGPTRHMDTSG